MGLSDSHDDRTPEGHVEGRNPSPPWVSHVAQTAFPTCHSHYPGGPQWVLVSAASPSHIGLPRYPAGSASTTNLSGPAQDSLALRPAGLQPDFLRLPSL